MVKYLQTKHLTLTFACCSRNIFIRIFICDCYSL